MAIFLNAFATVKTHCKQICFTLLCTVSDLSDIVALCFYNLTTSFYVYYNIDKMKAE